MNENFSIILPGPCNAKCDFCFWKRNKNESLDFLTNLDRCLSNLGSLVTQISITGGEPTLSPYFDYLFEKVLNGYKKIKIVLTTNGINLSNKIQVIKNIVKHVNISRHDIGDDKNNEIFGATMPSTAEIKTLCNMLNKIGIDVTINCVIPPTYNDYDELIAFINWAKNVHASALCLRKDFTSKSLNKTLIENLGVLGYPKLSTSCPVCVVDTYIVNGFPVYFKRSYPEPSKYYDGIYEYVFHPNGHLYKDWSCNQLIKNLDLDRYKETEKDARMKIKEKIHKITESNIKKTLSSEYDVLDFMISNMVNNTLYGNRC